MLTRKMFKKNEIRTSFSFAERIKIAQLFEINLNYSDFRLYLSIKPSHRRN